MERVASQADKYAAAVSAEARERQELLARERHVCCGMPKLTGHHDLCSKRPADEPAPAVEGQTTFL